ncbi:uncharacterized protein LY89DRAFT_110784 [Mollisia scopiformis]|uniref:DUF676 domain-containing protein n=1 Tax=Mollisia scopiformis TaxID=149040 RepID=A0A194X6C5_MOLSC|nr:uncharacterized protein LY89DRAFT_110784 [Mollisia scopiformis]KUJ15362.1 hypothetical protein LY89DRAFT_110784 [Mollisia scopiformis]
MANDIHNSLVLVSGTAVPRLENDRDPKTFFTQRFPKSLIDEFLFMDSSADSERLLYQRSTVLLEQLHNSRGSSTLPIVFLAHGLGGFVVKQTLISATEEPRYRDIALHTSTILFFGASHRATPQMSWEHLYLRLLSASGSLPPHPLKLVQRLVEELEGVSASFRTISCSFDVVNFYEAGPHPLVSVRLGS